MAEESAIMNNRSIVPVSVDSGSPYILTPATLLTQKTADAYPARHLGEYTDKDLFRAEWRRVQSFPTISGDGGEMNISLLYKYVENRMKFVTI